MSVRRRRYDTERINLIKYNSIQREKEISLYSVIDYNERDIFCFIDDHTDFVILFIIVCWKKNFITEQECNKLIDIVEGYYFAYEEELINAIQLYQKLNSEIMQEALHQKDWDKMGILGGVFEFDFSK